jgi:hypothetical protein
MVEMINKGEPAIMLCHWPGIYCNGLEVGFRIFQKAVTRLNRAFADRTRWMKLSEIARYWAAKELTAVRRCDQGFALQAPFAAPDFTLKLPLPPRRGGSPIIDGQGGTARLAEVDTMEKLRPGTWCQRSPNSAALCFALPRGETRIVTSGKVE